MNTSTTVAAPELKAHFRDERLDTLRFVTEHEHVECYLRVSDLSAKEIDGVDHPFIVVERIGKGRDQFTLTWFVHATEAMEAYVAAKERTKERVRILLLAV